MMPLSKYIPAPSKTQTAGLVVLTSALLLNEGISRTSLYVATPSGKWGGDHTTFPPVVLLIAGIGLSLYSLISLMLGFAELVFDVGNSTLTFVALVVEGVLGWFFFTSNVLAAYPFMLARAPGPMPPFNGVQSNTIIMMGMLGAMGAGVPLLGAHFFFMLLLMQQQRGRSDKYTPDYFRARVYFYAFLLVLRGVSELVLGSLVAHVISMSELSNPVISIPYVIIYPAIAIVDGLLVLCFALVACAVAILRLRFFSFHFFMLAIFILMFELGTYILTQIGLSPAPKVVASILTGDALVGVLMPVYLIAYMREHSSTIQQSQTAV